MSRRLSVSLFVPGLVVLTLAGVFFVNQGPFERTPPGVQGLYWQDALSFRPDTAASAVTAPRTDSPYPRLLSPLASRELGAVRRARQIQAAIFLALFGVAAFLLTNRRIGTWAAAGGLSTLLLGPLVISARDFSPALPAAALLLAALILLDRRTGWVAWAGAGVLVAAAARFFPVLAWSLGGLLLLRALTAGSRLVRIGKGAVFLAATAAAVLLSSLAVPRQPVFPAILGVDVYRGHREAASGVSPRRADGDLRGWWSFEDYAREASRVRDKALTVKETNAYWSGKAVAEMGRNAGAELRRWGTKALAAFQGDPLPHEVGTTFLRDIGESGGLDVFVWAGRLLVPLGLWGLLWRRKRVGWVLGMAALSGFVVFMITFASPFGRLVSLVACGAGVGFWLQGMVRERSRWLGVLGALVALGVWGFLPLHGGVPGLGIQGDDYYYLGTVYDQEKRGSAAMREYERSIRLDPTNPYPHLAIAAMLARDNVNEEAVRQLEQLRARYPDYPPVVFALVQLYQAQEQWMDAAAAYGQLIQMEPWNPEHWNNLGTVYVQMGYYEQAVRALDSALKVDPDYHLARENRALLDSLGFVVSDGTGKAAKSPLLGAQRRIMDLIQAGNLKAATDSLNAAYARFGRNQVQLRFMEGTLALMSEDEQRAVDVYESIRDNPAIRNNVANNVILLYNLATAYKRLGRLKEANATYAEAYRLQPGNERVRRGLATTRAALDSLAALKD